MNEKEFNTIFDEAFEKVVSEVDIDIVPDYTTAWGKTRIQMKNQRARKNRFKKIQIASGIAGMILLGSIMFSLPIVSDALDPIMSRIVQTRDQITHFFDGNKNEDGMYTDPPPVEVIWQPNETQEDLNLNSTGKRKTWKDFYIYKNDTKSFPIPEPQYLPEQYKFKLSYSYTSKQDIYKVQQFYTNSNNNVLTITADRIADSNYIPSAENYTLEEKKLNNGMIIKIYVFQETDIRISTVVDGTMYLLTAQSMTENEAIRIMENITIINN